VIGTLSLIALIALGFMQYSTWFAVPLAVVNTFIGMHTPPERVERLREMGESYWGSLLSSLPLQALLAAVLYGLGFGANKFLGLFL
jgi:hypothetical protein